MTRKIFRNSFLVGISVLLMCSVLFFGVMYSNYENQAFDRLAAEADDVSHALELMGEPFLDTLKTADRITWVAHDGTVLFDSAADPKTMGNHLQREEIREALKTGVGESSRYSSTLLERNHYYALLLKDGTVLRVACTQSSVQAVMLMLLTPFLWVMVLVLVLCGVLAFRLAKQITKPINAISLDDPVSDKNYKELAPFLNRIQEQNRTIRKQMDELGLRQREFTAITENMREGFLLVDGKMNILSSNHSAMQLLTSDPEGELTALRQPDCRPEILSAVDTALTGSHAELFMNAEEGVWQLVANPVVANGQVAGAVVIFMDVTEREQREALRREFSANVSHELKTPLTSISGFAELMQAGIVPQDKMLEFSSDIYRESQRLIALVDDIIKLSRLDENVQSFEKEPVDLYDLCQDTLTSLRPVADKRGIRLNLTGERIVMTGVRQLLSEMVYNLCDNAVKYNVENGSVTVTLSKGSAGTILSVADTGIGIPYAHQSRVFERFYRVDKSHSKEVGGTGLGLSIVKHAAQYHGARLELASETGKGTTIRVIFPA
jgi:two-component system phosphate regulon sensor histidine kinase PhoR